MLGRCENLNDIHIVGDFDMSHIRCSDVAKTESERLLKLFEDQMFESTKWRETHYKISYLNVRSLKAHIDDILKDARLLESNILAFGETWLEEEESVELPGFKSYFASHGKGKGVAVFSKLEIVEEPLIEATENYSIIAIRTLKMDVIFLYLSQGIGAMLEEKILKWVNLAQPTAIMGDMNWHFEENSTNAMQKFLYKAQFQQLITKPSHEQGHVLDQIYVNHFLLDPTTYQESHPVYYSDHDIISLFTQK